MQTTPIRGISAALINEAGTRREPLAITNDGALCGVFVPVDPQWVHRAVEDNLSRILHNIERGEKEIRSRAPASSLAAQKPSDQATTKPKTQSMTLTSAPSGSLDTTGWPTISVRDLSGTVIKRAAEDRTGLFVTTGGKLSGLLIPVTPAWVQQVVERNLSRIVYNIERGEKEVEAQEPVQALNDWTFTLT